MGMILPTLLISYHQYKEYDIDNKIRELRENKEKPSKKKCGCKYIWGTRCRSFAKSCRIQLENMSEERQ